MPQAKLDPIDNTRTAPVTAQDNRALKISQAGSERKIKDDPPSTPNRVEEERPPEASQQPVVADLPKIPDREVILDPSVPRQERERRPDDIIPPKKTTDLEKGKPAAPVLLKPPSQSLQNPNDRPAIPSFDVITVRPQGDAVIFGRAAAGAEVLVELDGLALGGTRANQLGKWEFTIGIPLSSGVNGISARSRLDGRLSEPASAIVIVPTRDKRIFAIVPASRNPNSPSTKLVDDICMARGVITESCPDYEGIIAALKLASLHFNVISPMYRGEAREIRAVIDASGKSDLRKALEGVKGKVIIDQVKVATIMTAKLGGISFVTTPLSEERQTISETGPTKWAWKVTPTHEGEKQALTLSFYAIIEYYGRKSAPRLINTYEKTVNVEVKFGDFLS